MLDSPPTELSPGCISRAQNGDLFAYEEIVRVYQGRIRAWVASHCPPGGDADEVSQKTFIAAHLRLSDFREGSNLGAWLFTIARFQLKTETTRLRRLADYHARFAPDLLDRELERRSELPPETTTARLSFLTACLSAMSDSSQRFVHWRYTEDLPLEEMAERTGRSVAAMKKQLWQIRQKLKECVDLKVSADAQGDTA